MAHSRSVVEVPSLARNEEDEEAADAEIKVEEVVVPALDTDIGEMVGDCVGDLNGWTVDNDELGVVGWTTNVFDVAGTGKSSAWIPTLARSASVCEATSRRERIGEREIELERLIVCVEDVACKLSCKVAEVFI